MYTRIKERGLVLCQWSLRYATTTRTRRDLVLPKLHAAVRYGVAVAAHGPFVAVENGAVDDVRVLAPVPVGLVAFVLAFVAEGGFIGPDVVAMPAVFESA